ncbi:hypothetical protein [Micromonospora haikouensis]|uniref:hypothetical protein n=1 Tax=Micromonospora haikouensis TaxID=686309 RepID=UPI003D73E090
MVFIDALVMKIRQRQVATGIVLAHTDVNNETHEIAQPSRHLARSAAAATP